MGMIGNYARVGTADVDAARTDPEQLHKRLLDARFDEADDTVIDVDKAWGGLGYLAERAGCSVHLGWGGEPIADEDWGYGPPRVLTAAEVAGVADFLRDKDFVDLAQHYDAEHMETSGLAPGTRWDDDQASLDYLAGHYGALRGLILAAADAGEPIVLWIS